MYYENIEREKVRGLESWIQKFQEECIVALPFLSLYQGRNRIGSLKQHISFDEVEKHIEK